MTIAQQVADVCERSLDFSRKLSPEYYYKHLPLCVIDSVFSIGVRYEGVRHVVQRYCSNFQLQMCRPYGSGLPHTDAQESVALFVQKMESEGIERFTSDIFKNRQRTSTKNGMLKTEAVLHFAKALQSHGIHYFQDVVPANRDELEAVIRRIPGQTSGISFRYFLMLAGSDDLIKPDRMILRFLEGAVGRPVSLDDAQAILDEVTHVLKQKHSEMTPRLLDHLIWNYQRDAG